MTGNDYEGTLIALEGIDGCGKSTLVPKLAEELRSYGYDVLETKEPTDMWTGKQVYRALSNEDESPLTDFFMFLADRARHVEKRIEPALSSGKIVLSDRYVDSTRAYQTHRIANTLDERDPTVRRWMEEVFRPWNIEPDIVLYLDISVDTSMERCVGMDKFEERENLTRVKRAYEDNLMGRRNTIRIDGERSKDEVLQAARRTVTRCLE